MKLLHYVFLSVLKNILNNIGDDEIRGTPVPMPNTAVKPHNADGTRKGRVGSRWVFYIRPDHRNGDSVFFFASMRKRIIPIPFGCRNSELRSHPPEFLNPDARSGAAGSGELGPCSESLRSNS